MSSLNITILAGGLGKRMKSTIPKVLHTLNNKPMLVRILEEARHLKPDKIIIVVGKYKAIIQETLIKHTNIQDIEFAIQQESLGTGDAVKSTLTHLNDKSYNLILNGDIPLIKSSTLQNIVDTFIQNNHKLQISCIKLPNPSGCGRIVMNNGIFESIIEHKDCTLDQLNIKLINVGIYVATSEILQKYIPLITDNNVQKEYYLTDLVKIYKTETNQSVGLSELDSSKIIEISNVNTKEQLEDLNL